MGTFTSLLEEGFGPTFFFGAGFLVAHDKFGFPSYSREPSPAGCKYQDGGDDMR